MAAAVTGRTPDTLEHERRRMGRLGSYLRTIATYSRHFSWLHLLLFKLNDLLQHWIASALMRRIRTLRLFAYAIPLDTLSLRGGEYQFSYTLNGTRLALALRANSSDVDVFLQVMRYHEYADVARLLRAQGPPPRIIDAGANIGLTTLYLKCFHPLAEVAAVEPEPDTFKRLSDTVRRNHLKHVTLVNAGLWTHDGNAVPDRGFRDGLAWSFALAEGTGTAEESIPVLSLDSLLARLGWKRVDLLKIDIEGAEARLMRDPAFLSVVRDRVGFLCMEVHEEAISRSEVQETFAAMGLRSVGGKETVIAWKA